MTNNDLITVRQACRIVGGEESSIHPATYYRGVAAGRFPAPVHVSPNVARVQKSKLVAALEQVMGGPMRVPPNASRAAPALAEAPDCGDRRSKPLPMCMPIQRQL